MDKSTKTIIGVVVAVVVIAGIYLLIQGPGGGRPAGTAEPIKLGFIGPLTGDVQYIGGGARTVAEYAVKEINDAGGINGRQLQLIAEDSQCTPTGGVNAVNKLVGVDKVAAIVGGVCSSETAPAAPIAQSAGTVLMSYCASAPGITKVGDYIFRDYPSDTYQAKFNAEYVYNVLKKRKAAILYVKNDWGQGMHDGFAARFAELGGKVVNDQSFDATTRDFRTILSKIKAANPDALVFFSYTDAGIPGIEQAKELGLKVPVIGGDAFDDPQIPQKAGAAADGVLYTAPRSTITSDFAAKYKSLTGKDYTICVGQAYDAVKILAKVMQTAGDDRKAIRDGLAQVKNYDGVSGNISFNSDGDLTTAFYDVKVMKGGKSEVVPQK